MEPEAPDVETRAMAAIGPAVAAGGNGTARDTFLPAQVLDQATWWWGYSRREIPLDLKRRTAPARPRLGP